MSTGLGAQDESDDRRWREWQARHAAISQTDAARMRATFTLLLLLAGAWLLWQWHAGPRPDEADTRRLGNAYVTPDGHFHAFVVTDEGSRVETTMVRRWPR